MIGTCRKLTHVRSYHRATPYVRLAVYLQEMSCSISFSKGGKPFSVIDYDADRNTVSVEGAKPTLYLIATAHTHTHTQTETQITVNTPNSSSIHPVHQVMSSLCLAC